MSRFRHLFHQIGWHRYCRPAMRRVGYTGTGNTSTANHQTGVFLMADYTRHE